jgi:amidase
LTIDAEEARIYRRHIVERLRSIDEFMRDPSDGERPPLAFGDRSRGHFPTPQEDPFAAWLWRCDIQGAESGLLHGKTVSFKDHIPVAGVPLTFGARGLSDFIPQSTRTIPTTFPAVPQEDPQRLSRLGTSTSRSVVISWARSASQPRGVGASG